MIKTINVEPIKFREKYLSTPLLTKAEVEKAMDYVVAQTRANMDYFGTKFPWSATKGLKYPIIENIEWTDGFWTGLCGCAMSTPAMRLSVFVLSRTLIPSCIVLRTALSWITMTWASCIPFPVSPATS